MPRKYYRKKRRFSKKKKSTFYYYKRRGAKQQAYQISKLNKRINRVYKNLGGTVERVQSGVSYGNGWPDTYNVAQPGMNGTCYLTLTPQGQTPQEILYRGCYANIDISFKYPVSTYSATTSTSPVVWYRFIVIQYFQAGESYTIQDFITNTTVQAGIFEPLNEDCGTKARILRDFKVCINQQHPERHLKLRFKRRFRIKQAQGVNIQKNTIQLFWLTYNMGADSNNIGTYGPQCATLFSIKPFNYMIYDKQ